MLLLEAAEQSAPAGLFFSAEPIGYIQLQSLKQWCTVPSHQTPQIFWSGIPRLWMLWNILQIQLFSVQKELTYSLVSVTYIFFQFFEPVYLFASAIAFLPSFIFPKSFPLAFFVLFCLVTHMMTATFIFPIWSGYWCKLLLMSITGFCPALLLKLPEPQIKVLSAFAYSVQKMAVKSRILPHLFRQVFSSDSNTTIWPIYTWVP